MSMPSCRVDKLLHTMSVIESSLLKSRRVVVRLVGQIMPMGIIIGNVCHIMTKSLGNDIHVLTASTRDSDITFRPDNMVKSSFWKHIAMLKDKRFIQSGGGSKIVYMYNEH